MTRSTTALWSRWTDCPADWCANAQSASLTPAKIAYCTIEIQRKPLMDKSKHPTSFGVFKPVGHIVVALATQAQADALARSLLDDGFTAQDLVHYTAQEMMGQVDADLLTASPLAALGQDLNLVKAHRALAEGGSCFLVVHAEQPEKIERVTALAGGIPAQSAQRYGSLIVEELLSPAVGGRQMFESSDTGLDRGVAGSSRS